MWRKKRWFAPGSSCSTYPPFFPPAPQKPVWSRSLHVVGCGVAGVVVWCGWCGWCGVVACVVVWLVWMVWCGWCGGCGAAKAVRCGVVNMFWRKIVWSFVVLCGLLCSLVWL